MKTVGGDFHDTFFQDRNDGRVVVQDLEASVNAGKGN